MSRNDEIIKKDIVDQLFWDNRVDAGDVKVAVKNGEVTLTGTVPSYRARSAAYTNAWLINDVGRVNDYLIVIPPNNLKFPDQELETRIMNNLLWSVGIDSSKIKLSVKDGEADLSGSVDMYWKKWEAENLALEVGGVKKVNNAIVITPTDKRIDKDIAQDIEKALDRNRYVDSENVTVLVKNSKATLSGIVHSYYARMRAEDSALFTPGVLGVQNDLVVT